MKNVSLNLGSEGDSANNNFYYLFLCLLIYLVLAVFRQCAACQARVPSLDPQETGEHFSALPTHTHTQAKQRQSQNFHTSLL